MLSFGRRESKMTLGRIFAEPLDPNRSIQLNNRYWPGDRFGLLSLIAEAESLVQLGELARSARELQRLRGYFGSDRYFSKFLHRLHRLHAFRSPFGCMTGKLNIAESVIKANEYAGPATRASYPLREGGSLAGLIRDTARIYKEQYGADALKTTCSVRYARRDERHGDISDFGILSDYHNDEYKGISTIVYLSDVTDENGAFSYIAGSHLIPRALVLTAIHQSVEFDMRLTKPDILAGLPLEFRGSVGIGNFLDEEKLGVVTRFRRLVEGPAGTFVTFNGQYVLHRGGKPTSGYRTAAFIQSQGMLRHKLKSVGSHLFALVHG
jgi:hypothetical protein